MKDVVDDWANATGAGVATLVIAALLAACGLALSSVFYAVFGAEQHGIASVYSSHESHSKYTASGERMIDSALTAAHKSWPLGCRVLVRHGSRSTIVRINDRGPYRKGRVIDLSPAAARAVGISGLG
jgi:rare lipoprotein A